MVHLFTDVDFLDIGSTPINLAEQVELWHQWLEDATFEVVVTR